MKTATGYKQSTHGIMTVKQLLEFLQGQDPNTQIVIADKDGWYDNIGGVQFMEEDSAITFEIGVPVDPRQF